MASQGPRRELLCPLKPARVRAILTAAAGGESISRLIGLEGIRRTESGFAMAAVFEKLATYPRRKALAIANRSLADSDGCVRSWAVTTLRDFNYRFKEKMLASFGRDSDALVREEIVTVWAKRGGAKAINRLLGFLKDSDKFVRNAAAEAFCGLPTSRAIVPLSRLLKDRWDVVRCSAAEALGETGSRKAIPYLRKALRDPSPMVRSYVMTSLGKLGDRRSLSKLENINRNGIPSAKLSSAVALYLLGDRERLNEVASYLKSSDSILRCVAGNEIVWMVHRKDIPFARLLLKRAIRSTRDPGSRRNFRDSLRAIT